ncbi:NAD(P)-dependent iron-only hydrogenase catalytic subunit [Propionispira arboris]|uniref:NAD(P)-dependent iron-only hydrogenase catalytic subunit n=1 Tax=Propionispira arboris TaxID=84035 RepID=A0A1H6VDR8_9FIRM|nr:NADH-dependent [FeFe] hydrogenase, group A6 [Propionispira arboris]SEJ01144.1 NAD(P)-dependent iron-only hydrogenase catalytic subunit [Propionispira arboris]
MAKINVKINGVLIEVESGTRIIEAAKRLNIEIPHLCYHPDQRIKALCRICSVEVVGSKKMSAACSTYVWDGMEILTNTKKVYDTQKGILEMILANHKQDCLSCSRNGNCELQNLCRRFGIQRQTLDKTINPVYLDDNPCIERNMDKCVKCGRCDKICRDVQGVSAITWAGRSETFMFTTAYNKSLMDTDCVLCGQCTTVCPVGAIVEKDNTQTVREAIQDSGKHVIVQVAPAVRVALGDIFGLEKGTVVTGKMVTALKQLGFDKVFDTVFAADVTIMEEGNELLDRIRNNGILPMITSCSPGWVNYMEKHYSDQIDHLSTAKSPQQIFGAIAKSYYADKNNMNKKNIVTVSVMPCVTKKFEAARPEMATDGVRDVDIVITTRELAKMIQYAGIDFVALAESEFDSPLGEGTGAGVIFGTTGGVTEAAVRTVYEVVMEDELEKLEFKDARGLQGIKEAEVDLKGRKLKIAVAHGLANAQKIMEQIKAGTSPYTFIEIMACPGGCIGGGGQPLNTTIDGKKMRMDAIYEIDCSKKIRKSHENPEVQKLYQEFLGKPLSEKAHELLHTHYHKMNRRYDFSYLGES